MVLAEETWKEWVRKRSVLSFIGHQKEVSFIRFQPLKSHTSNSLFARLIAPLQSKEKAIGVVPFSYTVKAASTVRQLVYSPGEFELICHGSCVL